MMVEHRRLTRRKSPLARRPAGVKKRGPGVRRVRVEKCSLTINRSDPCPLAPIIVSNDSKTYPAPGSQKRSRLRGKYFSGGGAADHEVRDVGVAWLAPHSLARERPPLGRPRWRRSNMRLRAGRFRLQMPRRD